MESKEWVVWRKHSAIISKTITASDAARNSLLNKLYAAGLVATNAKIQIQGQTAMTGANTLVNELSITIENTKAKFHEIISVMAEVKQLKEVVEDMRKQCPNPNAAADGYALGMCIQVIVYNSRYYSNCSNSIRVHLQTIMSL